MFEREIKFIYNFTTNKTEKIGSYFTFEQLASVDIHPAILQYISAEIDFLIFEDRQKLLKNSAFDYSGENINKHFSSISKEIKKNKKFSFEYFKKLILYASSFNVNYLIRPRWALIKFLFDGEGHKSSAEIKQILNYLYFYKYQKKILSSYLNRKKILSINVTELEELLKKIDRLGLESYKKTMIDIALKSIAEFFNIGAIRKDKIPLPAIELFLQEKNMTPHIEQLKRDFPGDDKQSYLVSDIRKVLEKVLSEETEIISSKEENLFETQIPSNESRDLEPPTGLGEELDITEEIEEFQKQRSSEEFNPEFSAPQDEFVPPEPLESEEKVDWPENELTEPISEPVEFQDEASSAEELVEEPSITSADEPMKEEELFIQEDHHSLEIDLEDKTQNLSNEEIYSDSPSENNEHIEPGDVEEEKIEFFEDSEEVKKETIEDVIHEDIELKVEEEIINQDDTKSTDDLEADTNSNKKITSKMLDISDLLEHKNMTKIIEVVFDYDMEEFASLIEKVSSCDSKEQAIDMLNSLFENNRVNPSSKEAESFKMIIEEYFDHA